MEHLYLRDLLLHRKEDKLYKQYSNFTVDDTLDEIIRYKLKLLYWKKYLGIGYYKSHYENGCTLSEYIENIYKHIGNGDVVEGKKLLLIRLQVLRNNIISNNPQYTKYEVNSALVYRMFYANYKGFLFEEMLTKLLISNGFEVFESVELDNKYKIDMLVTNKENKYDVGLQCKSITYMNVSDYTKREHLKAHREAIYNAQCWSVRFIFHNNDLDVVNSTGKVLTISEIIDMIRGAMHMQCVILDKKNTYKSANK